jgi:AcrR family transcriptional regulator
VKHEDSLDRKTDLRMVKTRKALREALITLILEKGFESLSVQEITSKAMVNRSTFYRHYEDKKDLLDRGIDELLLELADLMIPLPTNPARLEMADPDLYHNIRLFLNHIRDNHAFYKVMLGKNGPQSFHYRLFGIAEEMVNAIEGKTSRLPAGPLGQLVPFDIVRQFMSGYLVSLASWWVNADLPYSVDDMVRYYGHLVMFGSFRALGYPPPEPQAVEMPIIGASISGNPSAGKPKGTVRT